ncbi:MAG: YvcK family protein [Slackia sp.]|nr:YvcK family protein [Slackia sp.]
MAEFIPRDTPFAYDPAATAAFARLQCEMGERTLHDTATPARAVVIGGGTGAPVSIRTLLSLEADVSAVVAMADDGGSTGILREEAGVLPPGDIRKCIAAMAADAEDPLTRAFKYRFSFARNHTLGNLMLAALEDATGSFPEAIAICERLLGARGHVYPSTLDKVMLCARSCDGRRFESQARACKSSTALDRVWLKADTPVHAYGPALDAIAQADLIVLGPGSLFTSIIPNLLVPGVIDAIAASRGAVLFVCSLADMQGETWGLSAREHFEALVRHGMGGLVDYMLVHSPHALRPSDGADRIVDAAARPPAPADPSACAVRPVRITYEDACAIQQQGPVVLVRDLADHKRPTWHDASALRDAMRSVIRLSRMRSRK